MVDNQSIDLIICALIDNSISSEDFNLLQEWAEESEDNRNYLRRQIQIQFASSVNSSNSTFDESRAISRFYEHLEGERSSVASIKEIQQEGQSFRTMPKWIHIAAAVALLLLILIPYAAFHAGQKDVKSHFAQVKIEAPDGSQLHVSLPDGTRVSLNSGSILSYSQGFGISNREVAINGEGYFEVRHNAELPFIINTKELTLNDIGTEFSFRNYSTDKEAIVELYDGKVSLDNNISRVTGYELIPGERVLMDKLTGKLTTSHVSSSAVEAKEMSTLYFKNNTITEIAKELSRCYGAKIEVDNSIANLRFYGMFDRKTDSLSDILATISSTKLLRYKMDGKTYILY